MKKIFININGLDGCTLHRLILPYTEVMNETDEFEFTWGFSKKDLTLQEKIDEIGRNDVLIFHRLLSDVMPYTICGINLIGKGGEINPEGNCIMVNNNKGSRGWVKAITKLVKNPELMDILKSNISKLTESGKYCLSDLTKDRITYLQLL